MWGAVPEPTINMNTSITFPSRPPALKLTRAVSSQPSETQWEATLAEERRRLQEDHDALRVREENLRNYESRLRALQNQIEADLSAAGSTGQTQFLPRRAETKGPFEADHALRAAWEKLHRALELFEAEQNHMRDERLAAREKGNEMKRREEEVTKREMWVADRERLIAEAMPVIEEGEPIAVAQTMSAVRRLTRGPFNMARSMFGGK